ncbi:MAG: hypothetical protein Q4G44_07990 [Alcaligenaceae bacterium]|nr:hypothetical protein [Alcaligenaceae bacterium]
MYRRKPAQQSTLTQTMNYDGLGRLREVKYLARTETYTYDGASNPLDIAALFSISQSPLTPRPTYGIQDPEHPPVESWATVLHNQVRLFQGDRYEYDARCQRCFKFDPLLCFKNSRYNASFKAQGCVEHLR